MRSASSSPKPRASSDVALTDVTGPGRPLPTLTDGRVLLRAAEPRDVPAIDAGMHDPDVVRWIGAPERTAEELLTLMDFEPGAAMSDHSHALPRHQITANPTGKTPGRFTRR